jgi:energy-coupling factor transporter ATP-binding protein EcfA2
MEITKMSPNTKEFPRELLAESPMARYTYFFEKKIAHPILARATDEVMRGIRYPAEDRVVYLFGPAGSGKTTLAKRLMNDIVKDLVALLKEDLGWLPAAYVECPNPIKGIYNWHEHFTDVLRAVHEILIRYKIEVDLGEPGMFADMTGKLFVTRGTTAEALRRAVEQCLKLRKVIALILDEAHHVGKVSPSPFKLNNQMDILKSMANRTGTVHVLCGTYELLPLLSLKDQLSRRAFYVHLPRYRIDTGDNAQIQQFMTVIAQFQKHLPLPKEPNIYGEYEYLFEGSLGCVGLLKEWLDRALARALDGEIAAKKENRTDETDFMEYLKLSVLPDTDLIGMIDQINSGEQEVHNMNDRKGELRIRLDTRPTTTACLQKQRSVTDDMSKQSVGGSNPGTVSKKAGTSKSGGAAKSPRLPGKRGNGRDKVGHDLDHSNVFANELVDAQPAIQA